MQQNQPQGQQTLLSNYAGFLLSNQPPPSAPPALPPPPPPPPPEPYIQANFQPSFQPSFQLNPQPLTSSFDLSLSDDDANGGFGILGSDDAWPENDAGGSGASSFGLQP